jgi:hypothetical protein
MVVRTSNPSKAEPRHSTGAHDPPGPGAATVGRCVVTSSGVDVATSGVPTSVAVMVAGGCVGTSVAKTPSPGVGVSDGVAVAVPVTVGDPAAWTVLVGDERVTVSSAASLEGEAGGGVRGGDVGVVVGTV